MIVLTGGDIVLPDRILDRGSLVLEGNRIAAVEAHPRPDPGGATIIDIAGGYLLPGFIDVHVHGVEGFDSLDGGTAVAEIAARLPRYGVTAFCPTTVACAPSDLRTVLDQVRQARLSRPPGSARVLPAHLESNFINPEYRGAQPERCLRLPLDAAGDHSASLPHFDRSARLQPGVHRQTANVAETGTGSPDDKFSARDILDVIASARADVGIVTLAPEIPGGLDLVRALVAAGHRVSLGHSGASFDTAIAAIEAGARHATHLFNRMTPMGHRDPGLPGAVLARDEVVAELICDGYHVHPAMCRMAIAAKGQGGMLAITDGTGGSGLPPGSRARLGGRPIQVGDRAAFLDDGTLAGSTLTMDRAFATIVTTMGLSIVDAARLCSTNPARALHLIGSGVIAEGAFADLTVLDRAFRVVRTFVDGVEVYPNAAIDPR